MKSCRQTAPISAKDTEGGDDTGLTAHIEPYCGEDWPVSTNVYNSQMLMAMQNITSDRVGLMKDPPPHTHIWANSFERAWRIQAGAVTETAMRLGCERGTFSRLLNGKAGVSANMALALEDIGWGTAGHWMRMQASYDLMQARRARVDSEKRDTALQQR